MTAGFVVLWMLVGAPAHVQARRIDLLEPDGTKKVGQYVWVWHSGNVSNPGNTEVEADCPVNYVVIGGGAVLNGTYLYESKPNQAFDGWIVEASPTRGTVKITVYASCAPAS